MLNHFCNPRQQHIRVASRIIDKAGTPFLQTLGSKPKPVVTVNPKKQLFTAQDIGVIQKDLSLSTRQVLTLAEDLRNSSGDKKIIEKNLKDKIRGFNRNLEDLFERRMCNFVNVNEAQKVKDNFQQHFVVCNNNNTLIDKIIEERSLNEENILIRIGLYGGSGFVKMSLFVRYRRKERRCMEYEAVRRKIPGFWS